MTSKQHLAIATGAAAGAELPLGADACIMHRNVGHAVAIDSLGVNGFAQWDIDFNGAGTLYGWTEAILLSYAGMIGQWDRNRTGENHRPAGDGGAADGQIPTSTGIALLAAGASGLRRWRKQRAPASLHRAVG